MFRFNQWLTGEKKRAVFIGDSITQIGTYIAYFDAYLTRHFPESEIELINLGVSCETASGLSEPDHPYKRPCIHNRIDRPLSESRPDAAVLCYGMNDGIYYPLDKERFDAYKSGMLRLIDKVKAYGAKVVVMAPPAFDAVSFKGRLLPDNCEKYGSAEAYEDYDNVMEKYAEWIMRTALRNTGSQKRRRRFLRKTVSTKRRQSQKPEYPFC